MTHWVPRDFVHSDVVMPNHIHGIVVLVGAAPRGNYYEHIIRDEASLNRIRQCILENPQRWSFDRENPAATAPEPEVARAQ